MKSLLLLLMMEYFGWHSKMLRDISQVINSKTFYYLGNRMVYFLNVYDATGLCVSMVRHPAIHPQPWFESRQNINYQFSNTEQKDVIGVEFFSLAVAANCEVYVSVHQKDKRCIGALEYIDIGNDVNEQVVFILIELLCH